MTPITQMRLTTEDKERIQFIREHGDSKTATAAIQAALEVYVKVLTRQSGGIIVFKPSALDSQRLAVLRNVWNGLSSDADVLHYTLAMVADGVQSGQKS